MSTTARRFRLPHPLVLLSGCVLLAAVLSYVLPAGEFDRQEDEVTGRVVVVAGTYHDVEQSPVNPFRAVVALPRGMAEAADVIFLVFLIGGAFTVVDEAGTLRRGVSSLVGRLGGGLIVIPSFPWSSPRVGWWRICRRRSSPWCRRCSFSPGG